MWGCSIKLLLFKICTVGTMQTAKLTASYQSLINTVSFKKTVQIRQTETSVLTPSHMCVCGLTPIIHTSSNHRTECPFITKSSPHK